MPKHTKTNKVKMILDKLGIKPTDEWQTKHIFKNKNMQDTCYYYTFEHKGITYCVSGDSYSFVFTDEDPFNWIYAGLDEVELEEAIRKVVSK
jgi:hypothetical protein